MNNLSYKLPQEYWEVMMVLYLVYLRQKHEQYHPVHEKYIHILDKLHLLYLRIHNIMFHIYAKRFHFHCWNQDRL